MVSDDTLVALAVITAPHGVRGEMRVKPYNPDSDLVLQLERLQLRDKAGSVQEVSFASARPHKQGYLVTLPGVQDRNAVDALRGAELCVKRSELPDDLAPDEWYVVDLIGLKARLPDGSSVGQVLEVLDYPSSQVMVVETPDGLLEVPMTTPYLVNAEPSKGEVVVDSLADLELLKPRKGGA